MPLILAVAIVFLSGFTDLKIVEVQTVELVVVLALGLSLMLPRQALSLEGPALIVNIIPQFVWMFFLVLCGSILSLRLNFYPPAGIGFLKQPPWATFIRFVEVTISACSLFIVALAIRNDARNLKLLLAAFVWGALANSVWGIVSFIGWLGGLELPGITPGNEFGRMRGFFGEGGPLGVYLSGAVIIQIIRGHYLKYISKRSYHAGLTVLLLALVGSQSKASVLVLFSLAMIYFARLRRAGLILVGVAVLLPVAVASNFVEGLNGYFFSLTNFEAEAAERPSDGNLVNGRLMASILLPRIVEAHPLIGIGIGNYGLVRNDPELLRGLPRTEQWDLHGLGLLGYCAELGIPLTLFVLWLYAYPLVSALRARPWVLLISSYPLLAALFGVQLNFAYPWVVAGLALGALAIDREYAAGRTRALSHGGVTIPRGLPPLGHSARVGRRS